MVTPRTGATKNSELARERILEAAVRRFSEVGYRAARVADVARAAGYSEAAVFHHFGSKAQLFAAVVAHLDAGARWFDADTQPTELPERLRVAELAYHRDGRWTTLDRAWSDAQSGESDLLEMIRPAVRSTLDSLTGILASAGASGRPAPELLARWIVAVSYGTRVMRRYDRDFLTPEECADLLALTARLAVDLAAAQSAVAADGATQPAPSLTP